MADIKEIIPNVPDLDTDKQRFQDWLYQNFLIIQNLSDVSGTFTTADGKTITVKNGIITAIVGP